MAPWIPIFRSQGGWETAAAVTRSGVAVAAVACASVNPVVRARSAMRSAVRKTIVTLVADGSVTSFAEEIPFVIPPAEATPATSAATPGHAALDAPINALR